MLEYNSQLKQLILPEYGRNIQQMVYHCMTIEDREERTRCAFTIVQIMGNMFPELRDVEDYRHKFWDHLAIMSDFKLDIDYPYDIVHRENLDSKPEPIHYRLEPIKYRHYGKIIEKMIERIGDYPEGEERDALISLIAHHMKKLIFAINKEGVEDEKIFKDLYWYSHGKICLDASTYKLRQFKEAPSPSPTTGGKKKKKK